MFYDVYERLCKQKNESPWNLPVKLGLLKSNSAVAQWKNGSVPRHKTLQALADYFGVSASYLMDLEKKEKPTTQEGDGHLHTAQDWDKVMDGLNQDQLLEIMSIVMKKIEEGRK